MYTKCDVCELRSLKVHHFPVDRERSLKWARSIGWEHEFLNINKKPRNIHICMSHFTPNDYDSEGRLRYGATPTLRTSKCFRLVSNTKAEVIDDIPLLVKEEYPHPYRSDENYSDISLNSPIPTKKNRIKEEIESDNDFLHGEASADESVMTMTKDKDEEKLRKKEEDNISRIKDEYFLLSKESLMQLLNIALPKGGCIRCGDVLGERTYSSSATTIVMNTNCPSCGKHNWSSTKRAHSDPLGSMYSGNADMITSIFLSGIPYERYCDLSNTMKFGAVSRNSFFAFVKNTVTEAVNSEFSKCKEETLNRIKKEYEAEKIGSKYPIHLTGDAQFDSRGFSATICRYTMIEPKTKLIYDHMIVSREETGGNSPKMESFAFKRMVDSIVNNGTFDLASITTDKSSAIISYMEKSHANIVHSYDKWHVVRSFKKNNEKEILLKRSAHLLVIWQHLIQHIWYSIEAASWNKELALEMIKSAAYHAQNIHILPKDQFKILDKCAHADMPANDDKPYLDNKNRKHKKQIEILEKMLSEPTFVDNVRKCNPCFTTSLIESFHSMNSTIYCKKNYYYDKTTTETLNKLAIMHHNRHQMKILDDAEAGVAEKTRKKFSRAQKRERRVKVHSSPPMEFKQNILVAVHSIYTKQKNEKILNRKVGRPLKALNDDNSDGEETNLDDDLPYDDEDDTYTNGDMILPLSTNPLAVLHQMGDPLLDMEYEDDE